MSFHKKCVSKTGSLLTVLALGALPVGMITVTATSANAQETVLPGVADSTERATEQTGVWGEVPWTFDPDTSVLTLHGSTDPSAPLELGAGAMDKPGFEPGYDSSSVFWRLSQDGYTVTKVIFENPEGITLRAKSNGLFTYAKDVSEIVGLEDVQTDRLQELSSAFQDLGVNSPTPIEKLDLSKWHIGQNILNLDYLFDCANVKTVDVTGWDTSAVWGMKGTFGSQHRNPSTIEQVRGIEGWNTDSAMYMDGMFYRSKLQDFDFLRDWNTSKVTNMNMMFVQAPNVQELDLSGWDVSSVTNMNQMFYGDSQLEKLDLSGWDTSAAFEKMSGMVGKTPKLHTLVLGSKSALADDAALGQAPEDDQFTGKWVGLDQVESDGSWWRGEADEVISRSQDEAVAAGTYTWQGAADVTFDLDGGAWVEGQEPQFAPGEAVTGVGDVVTYSDPTREDYDFTGWNSQVSAGNDSARSGADSFLVTEPGSVTLVAQWEKSPTEPPVDPVDPEEGTDPDEELGLTPGPETSKPSSTKPGNGALAQTGSNAASWALAALGAATVGGLLLATRKKLMGR